MNWNLHFTCGWERMFFVQNSWYVRCCKYPTLWDVQNGGF